MAEDGGAHGDGLFLVFEGVEASGKSTQARRLADRLEAAGVEHRLVREPGGTEAGERIREVVLDPDLALDPRTELLLMLAARAEFVRRSVRPALKAGEVVLADRYELSTFAYQGLARGLGLERVRRLNRFATGGLRPDATLVLMVDPEEARARRSDASPDRMEGEGADFHAAVDRAYRRLARQEEGAVAVNASGSPDEVEVRIRTAVAERWPDLLSAG